MQETIYLKIEENSFVTQQNVRLSDVASIYCSNATLQNEVSHMVLTHFEKSKKQVVVISVMEIIRRITSEHPETNVCNLGETDFIVEYGSAPKKNVWNFIKILITCVIVLVGSAYTIMAYNNDVGVKELFSYCYQVVLGGSGNGVLELTYSVGLALGIIVFYNHFVGKKLSNMPTPVEVQMRSYENDINNAIVARASRGHLELGEAGGDK